jgi:hypothetical protein
MLASGLGDPRHRKSVKTVKAVLVTGSGRQPAMLSVDEASTNGLAVLTVDGVAKAPEDLPKGAYLKIDSSEMADQAASAGYFIHPRSSRRRRWQRIEGSTLARRSWWARSFRSCGQSVLRWHSTCHPCLRG